MPVNQPEKKAGKSKRNRLLILSGLLLAALILIFSATRAVKWAERERQTRLLTLVNLENPVPDDYNVEFTLLGEGQMLDSRCVDDLELMLSDCAGAGGSPQITASFRTWSAQQELYDTQVQELLSAGYSTEEAETRAARLVAPPGTSEHQLGLALDLADASEPEREDGFTVLWLHENSWRYGFILRYPADKAEVTGTAYSPWHYRYVGVEAAGQIHALSVCLEEYIQMFYS